LTNEEFFGLKRQNFGNIPRKINDTWWITPRAAASGTQKSRLRGRIRNRDE